MIFNRKFALIIILLVSFFYSEIVIAQIVITPIPQPLPEICRRTDPLRMANGDYAVTTWVIWCTEDILTSFMTNNVMNRIRNALNVAASAVFTLVIIFLGLKYTLRGAQETRFGVFTGQVSLNLSETLPLIFKMLFIMLIFFSANMIQYYNMLKGIMMGFVQVVTNTTINVNGCNNFPPGDRYLLWYRTDCIINRILDVKNNGLNGIFDLAPFRAGVGMFFSSIGALINLIIYLTLFFVVTGFATAVLAYVSAIFAIAILFMFAPIFLPMFLFKPDSFIRKMFDQWFMLLLSFVLQPAVLFAYLAFMLSVLLLVIYGPGGPGSPSSDSLIVSYSEVNAALNSPETPRKGDRSGPAEVPEQGLVTFARRVIENPPNVPPQPGDPIDIREDGTIKSFMALPNIVLTDPVKAKFLVNLIVLLVMSYLTYNFMLVVIEFSNHIMGSDALSKTLAGGMNLAKTTIGMVRQWK